MTDIREQLLKAGLITQAQASPTPAERPSDRPSDRQGEARTGRRHRGGRGGGGGGGGGGGERGERGAQPEGRRAAKAPLPEGPPPTDESREEASRLAIAERVELKSQRGGKRWYYVSRDGLVPYVELGDDVAAQLGRGELALVESPEAEAWFVRGEVARRLAQLDRAWVRAYNG